MSNANRSSQHATVSDHLDTLQKLSKFLTETNADNERQLEEWKKQIEELRRKVESQQKKCVQSKKRMQDAKMELEQAEKNLDVIDLAADDEIGGGGQTRHTEESLHDKRRRLVPTETPLSTSETSDFQFIDWAWAADDEIDDEIGGGGQTRHTEEPLHDKRRRLMPTETPTSTSDFRISVGRTRELLNKSVDVVRCLSGSKFSQGSFGTQTIHNGPTKITFLVLNDEWNELVTHYTAQQMFYVGIGKNKKRFGHAVVDQDEAFPFFHAPKKSKKTCDIFYVGHWKSVSYRAYDPPIFFKGKPRQMLIGLEFVRYDETLERAIAAS